MVSELQMRRCLWHYQLASISLDISSLPRELFEEAENKKLYGQFVLPKISKGAGLTRAVLVSTFRKAGYMEMRKQGL